MNTSVNFRKGVEVSSADPTLDPYALIWLLCNDFSQSSKRTILESLLR